MWVPPPLFFYPFKSAVPLAQQKGNHVKVWTEIRDWTISSLSIASLSLMLRSQAFFQYILLLLIIKPPDDSAPSVFSLKKAMQTYARQGGTSAIFVHDDGLQLLGEKERQKRISFYADHNIGWVARPPHSSAADGYKRAGRFKKASNMNYGLQVKKTSSYKVVFY